MVAADDPAALSSTNEEDSRFIAKLGDLPLMEPATFQEAKDMTKYAFDLSESINSLVVVRSVSRISHARGNVILGELPKEKKKARYDTSKIFIPVSAPLRHLALHLKLKKVQEKYESSPFNWYQGPEKPELLLITSGSGWFYSLEAVNTLSLKDSVGILKIGTAWPLPPKLLAKHMANAKRVLFVEEVDPFLENNVKELAAEWSPEIGSWTFFGKSSGHVNPFGEINPDLIINALAKVMDRPYAPREPGYGQKALEMTKALVPNRDLGFCAGCPHRATFWAIKTALKLDGRGGFVTGDIGCYSIGLGPAGFYQLKTMHAMGSGTGIATGLGQLQKFGFDQPVLSVCGDSTFFHAAIPALINGVYNKSNFVMVVLDNSATAMTGFQPHAGTGETATGSPAPTIDIEKLCQPSASGWKPPTPSTFRVRPKKSWTWSTHERRRAGPDFAAEMRPGQSQGRKGGLPDAGRSGKVPRGSLRLRPDLHPDLQMPGVDLEQGKREIADRRGDLQRLRSLRGHLPPGGHHPGGKLR